VLARCVAMLLMALLRMSPLGSDVAMVFDHVVKLPNSDAAIQALFDSGIRGVHASGAPQTGEWDRQWPRDLERIQKRFFTSDDQLVTLRMFAGLDRENWALARKLGLRITSETSGVGMLEQFSNEKLLGPDNTYNHCNGWTDDIWRRVRDSGGTVNVCPRSDPQYGLSEGIPAFQKALDHGIRPAAPPTRSYRGQDSLRGGSSSGFGGL